MNPNRAWKNKETGKVYKVRPYWECPDPDKELSEMIEDGFGYKPIKVGTLYQAGWLMWNESVYFDPGLRLDGQYYYDQLTGPLGEDNAQLVVDLLNKHHEEQNETTLNDNR